MKKLWFYFYEFILNFWHSVFTTQITSDNSIDVHLELKISCTKTKNTLNNRFNKVYKNLWWTKKCCKYNKFSTSTDLTCPYDTQMIEWNLVVHRHSGTEVTLMKNG